MSRYWYITDAENTLTIRQGTANPLLIIPLFYLLL
jgi:hypothetical protein